MLGCSNTPAPERPEGSASARPVPEVQPRAIAKVDDRPVIVAFGDSLTAGMGVGPALNYSALLEKRLDAEGRRYRVVNAGVSGDTSGGGLARIDSVLAYQPQIVILELGANDGLRGLPVESTRANLEQIIIRLQQAGVKVVLAGMTLPPNYGAEYVRSFERVFVDLSKQYKTQLIPFLLDNVAVKRELMQDDGLHPNAAGHRVMADHVMKALKPLLE